MVEKLQVAGVEKTADLNSCRCVKIMAAEHRYRLLQSQKKSSNLKRPNAQAPEQPAEEAKEDDAEPDAGQQPAKRPRSKAKAKAKSKA